jgi:ribosomal protein L28
MLVHSADGTLERDGDRPALRLTRRVHISNLQAGELRATDDGSREKLAMSASAKCSVLDVFG